MNKLFLTTLLIASTVVASAASAQGYRSAPYAPPPPPRYEHRDHGHSNAGVALGAGILGLAVGTMIASRNSPAYYEAPTYYAPPARQVCYSGRDYYGRWFQNCHMEYGQDQSWRNYPAPLPSICSGIYQGYAPNSPERRQQGC